MLDKSFAKFEACREPRDSTTMRKLLFYKLICILMTCLVACRESDDSELSIVGGEPVDAQSPAFQSTVALVRKDGNSLASFCSASLIAPNLVLTAAHCAEDAKNPRNFQVLFGNNVKDPSAKLRDVVAMQTFKGSGSRFFPNFDIAWIKLKENAPEGYAPAEILRSPRALDRLNGVDDQMLLAGFGRTSTFCDRAEPGCTGMLYQVRSKLKHFVNEAHFVSLLVIGPKPGHGSCNGDSGGPVFTSFKGRWYLLGELNGKSPLLNSQAVLDPKACESGEAIYTFAGNFVDWIESTSGVKLAYNSKLNPRDAPEPLMDPEVLNSASGLEDFLVFNNHNEPVWETMEAIVAGFKDPKRRPDGDYDAIITNPALTADAIRSWPEFFYDGIVKGLGSIVQKREQLVDVRPIGQMSGLRSLMLINNRIEDFGPLGNLRFLEDLTIQNNYDFEEKRSVPMNLQFLGSLPALKSLDLSNNARNIELARIPWQRLDRLERLDLSNNPGTLDLSRIPWGLLQSLHTLTIDNSSVDNIDALGAARNLQVLSLRNNAIRSIKSLAKLPRLEEIDLTLNSISDFSPLKDLPRLRSIKALSNPQLVSICPRSARCTYSPSDLADFASYCHFAAQLSEKDRLAYTGSKTVQRILLVTNAMLAPPNDQCEVADAKLMQMTTLNLSGRGGPPKIADLRPISPLKHLEVLQLDNNEIVDITPLEGFTRLRILNLASNRIESVEVLSGLPSLKEVNLDDNKISFFGALKEKFGLMISFLRNP